MQATITKVTPDLAQQWLAVQRVNRPAKPQHVKFLASLMAAGQFTMTGEPIQFMGYLDDGTAVLVNGQHRLNAIVASGKTVEMLVVEGVAPDSQVFMDSGSRRSFADVLAMNDVPDRKGTAALVRMSFIYNKDQGKSLSVTGGGSLALSNQDLLTHYEANATEISAALAWGRRIVKVYGGPNSAYGLAWMLFSEIDYDEAVDFFDSLISGADLSAGDPILALIRWLNNARIDRTNHRAPEFLAVIIKAWNARVTNTPMKLLLWRAFGPQQEAFPVPRRPVGSRS